MNWSWCDELGSANEAEVREDVEQAMVMRHDNVERMACRMEQMVWKVGIEDIVSLHGLVFHIFDTSLDRVLVH